MTPDLWSVRPVLREEAADALGRLRGSGGLVPAFPVLVGRVFANPAIPARTGTYVSVHPVEVSGAESEGAAGTLTVDASRTFLAYVVGPTAPVSGDHLLCRFIGDRWLAERMGGSTTEVIVPGCPCASSPAALHMTASRPDTNNGIFQTSELVYGPTPPGLLSLGIGTSAYLSRSSHTDSSTGDQFRYYLSCFQGFYLLTRVYEKSAYGSPHRDTMRYRWLAGFPGNTCRPFLLTNGQMYPGGDTACVVTISE